MPEMPGDEFAHIVATFPRQFGSQLAFYFNGTFVHTIHARRKNRNPQFGPDGNEVEIDDSNCLLAENGGRLQPGVLLETRCDADGEESVADGVAANAGLAVTKDGEIRLTCPSHLFDGQNSKVCYHGNVIVGELDQTLGEDIGLLETVVSLSSEFISVDCIARKLIKSNEIPDDDIISVDSCFTSPQPMLYAGSRTGKRNRRGTPGPSYPYWYVVIEQRISPHLTPAFQKRRLYEQECLARHCFKSGTNGTSRWARSETSWDFFFGQI
jgi:hypothetical protein